MMEIIWTKGAFEALETLPEAIAFEIVRRVDALTAFPEMGAPIRFLPEDSGYRQIVVKRRYRAVYRVDKDRNLVFIAAVQACRQQLPHLRDLDREIREGKT